MKVTNVHGILNNILLQILVNRTKMQKPRGSDGPERTPKFPV